MTATPNGNVAFLAGEERYVLNFAINAICTLEAEFEVKAEDIGQLLQDGKVTTIRTLFRIALEENHESITDKQAGAIMAQVGIEQVSELLLEAIFAAFPDMKPEEGKSAARPPRTPRKAGTG